MVQCTFVGGYPSFREAHYLCLHGREAADSSEALHGFITRRLQYEFEYYRSINAALASLFKQYFQHHCNMQKISFSHTDNVNNSIAL
jgi:hypothetical protein